MKFKELVFLFIVGLFIYLFAILAFANCEDEYFSSGYKDSDQRYLDCKEDEKIDQERDRSEFLLDNSEDTIENQEI